MEIDFLKAKVHQGLLKPKLVAGVPQFYAMLLIALTYMCVIQAHAYWFLVVVVALYVIGTNLTKKDPFWLDAMKEVFTTPEILI